MRHMLANGLARLAAWIGRPSRREQRRRQALADLVAQFPEHRAVIVGGLVAGDSVATVAAVVLVAEVRRLRTEVADAWTHMERMNAARHGAMIDQLQAVARQVRA